MQRLQTVKASGVKHFRWTTSAQVRGRASTEVTSETHLCGSAGKAGDLTGALSVDLFGCGLVSGDEEGKGRPTLAYLRGRFWNAASDTVHCGQVR